MSRPENSYNAGNDSLPLDLEAYERSMLSRTNSLPTPEPSITMSGNDLGCVLEDYEKKLVSGQRSFAGSYVTMAGLYEGVPAEAYGDETLLSRFQSVDFYDWPAKFGKGDTSYDQQATAWIRINRANVTDFVGLNKVKYKSSEYNGYNYNGHPTTDPAPNWGLSDATQAPVYEGIRKELFGEGGASSINTYDDQLLTIGWGFSVRNELGRSVLYYSMQASPSYKEKLLAVGISADTANVYYIDAATSSLLRGDAALQKIRWDQKVLSQLIIAAEAAMDTNIGSQVKVFKQYRMKDFPSEGFGWPVDSVRLAVHLKHWLPVGINWGAIRSSGGNVATIVKHFCRNIFDYQENNHKSNYFLRISKLANNALYVDDKDSRFHIGNDAMVKAGNAGTIPTVALSAFNDTYKTAAQYAAYIFVAHKGKVYLLS
jgi:hypothetical protein